MTRELFRITDAILKYFYKKKEKTAPILSYKISWGINLGSNCHPFWLWFLEACLCMLVLRIAVEMWEKVRGGGSHRSPDFVRVLHWLTVSCCAIITQLVFWLLFCYRVHYFLKSTLLWKLYFGFKTGFRNL